MKQKSIRFVVFTMLLVGCIRDNAAAQNIVRGIVVDRRSKQPLEGAEVNGGNGAGEKGRTDEYGNFVLNLRSSGGDITVSHEGFKAVTVAADSSVKQIEMQSDIINLDAVTLQVAGIAKFNTIAKIDLSLNPVKNTQELLRIVPGLFIAQHAGGGKAEQIFLRGFDCDHGTDMQVSVDGMPVNMVSHAHGQGYADAHFIIPETINNIDFGAGPYYAEHGDFNTAGYVSFSTFKNIGGSTVQLEAGRFNTFRALAMLDLLKKNKEKQSAYLAGELCYGDGPTENKQHFNRFNIFGKYNAALSAKTNLSLSGSAFSSRWNASGQVPERAVNSGFIGRFGSIDPSEGGNTERYNMNASAVHTFRAGTAWENRLFYSRYRFNLFSNFTFFLNDPINGDEINQAEQRNIFGFLSAFKQKKFIGNAVLSSIYAAGARHDNTNGSRLSNTVNRVIVNDVKLGDVKETNVYAYTQQQITKGQFTVSAGVRYDYFHFDYFDKLSADQLPSQQVSVVSPKFNVQHNASKAMQFYVKAGKGFHSNDARVVIPNNGKQTLPAAYGLDLGVILKPAKNLLINIAAWNLYLQQEFVYVGDDGNVEPGGKTRRRGLDIIGRYQFTKSLFANVNINFTKPRAIGEAKGEDYIPLAPTATSTGGLFYKKLTGFNGGLTYRYIKSRPANEDNSIVAKGYFLLDGSINYTKRKYEAGLSLENIFNINWNEAQFATESRLRDEPDAVTELNFTPGTPFFIKAKLAVFF